MKKFVIFPAVALLLFFLTGCGTATISRDGSGQSDRDGYYEVKQPNTPRSFIDIGSALKWRKEQCVLHQSAFDGGAKVADFVTGEEVEVSEAVFVAESGIETPGGFDTIAFKDRESAEKFISERGRGRILTIDELTLSD